MAEADGSGGDAELESGRDMSPGRFKGTESSSSKDSCNAEADTAVKEAHTPQRDYDWDCDDDQFGDSLEDELDAELTRELDRQMDTMFEEYSNSIHDDIQNELDRQLEAQFEAQLQESHERLQQQLEDDLDRQLLDSLHEQFRIHDSDDNDEQNASPPDRQPTESSVASINATIQRVIDQHQ